MRIVIFDFDGTLTVGDDFVLRYAREAIHAIPIGEREAFQQDIQRDFYVSGSNRWNDVLDGFDMVRRDAIDHQADGRLLAEAYLKSREALAAGMVHVKAPEGLSGFVSHLPAYRVLATNSPRVGIVEALQAFGISQSIDEIHTDVGKPDGLIAIIEKFVTQIGSRNVLSIGDIWENDLFPAHVLGCATALITHGRNLNSPATFVANELPDLYTTIMQWARAPEHHSKNTHCTNPTFRICPITTHQEER